MENRKPLLKNYDDLLDKLGSVGVNFTIIDKDTAKQILQHKNYYFKLSSYRKNFPKINNKYNIEFAYLTDFAVIDMITRYFLLDISLDIEHAIKTRFMHEITINSSVDGYDFLSEFQSEYPTFYAPTLNTLEKNEYLNDLYSKHALDIPIWVFVEVCGFGCLMKLIEFYWANYGRPSSLKPANQLSKFARNVRNSSAHSNVFLLDIYKRRNRIACSQSVKSYARNVEINPICLERKKLHDLFCLMYLHKEYCSEELQTNRRIEADKIINRINKHAEYYTTYPTLQKLFKHLKLSVK